MSSDRSPGEESETDERTSLTAGSAADDSTSDGSTTDGTARDGRHADERPAEADRSPSPSDPAPLPSDPDRRYRLTAEESAVDTVLQEVSTLRDCDPLDLPPLFDVVDTDLLDGVHERGSTGAATWLTFAYAGYLVTLTGRGYLLFRRIDDAAERFVE